MTFVFQKNQSGCPMEKRLEERLQAGTGKDYVEVTPAVGHATGNTRNEQIREIFK